MYLSIKNDFTDLIKVSFSAKDYKFTLKDKSGKDRCYIVRDIRSGGEKFRIYDLDDKEIALVHYKGTFFTPKIDIYINDTLYKIKAKDMFAKFILEGTDLRIEGTWGRLYKYKVKSDVAGTIGLIKSTSLRPLNFEIDIVDESYLAHIISIAVMLDWYYMKNLG